MIKFLEIKEKKMGMCKFFLYFYLIRSLVLIQVNQEIIKKLGIRR